MLLLPAIATSCMALCRALEASSDFDIHRPIVKPASSCTSLSCAIIPSCLGPRRRRRTARRSLHRRSLAASEVSLATHSRRLSPSLSLYSLGALATCTVVAILGLLQATLRTSALECWAFTLSSKQLIELPHLSTRTLCTALCKPVECLGPLL